jgi:hypothetical protein
LHAICVVVIVSRFSATEPILGFFFKKKKNNPTNSDPSADETHLGFWPMTTHGEQIEVFNSTAHEPGGHTRATEPVEIGQTVGERGGGHTMDLRREEKILKTRKRKRRAERGVSKRRIITKELLKQLVPNTAPVLHPARSAVTSRARENLLENFLPLVISNQRNDATRLSREKPLVYHDKAHFRASKSSLKETDEMNGSDFRGGILVNLTDSEYKEYLHHRVTVVNQEGLLTDTEICSYPCRFSIDIDGELKENVPMEELLEITQCIQGAVSKYFPESDTRVIFLYSKPKPKIRSSEHHPQICVGVHLVFPDIYIFTPDQGKQIVYHCNLLVFTQFNRKDWLDAAIYRSNHVSLRGAFSRKIIVCPHCFGADGMIGWCIHCSGCGQMAGSFYKPLYILEAKSSNPSRTPIHIECFNNEVAELCSIRETRGGTRKRDNYRLPRRAPVETPYVNRPCPQRIQAGPLCPYGTTIRLDKKHCGSGYTQLNLKKYAPILKILELKIYQINPSVYTPSTIRITRITKKVRVAYVQVSGTASRCCPYRAHPETTSHRSNTIYFSIFNGSKPTMTMRCHDADCKLFIAHNKKFVDNLVLPGSVGRIFVN